MADRKQLKRLKQGVGVWNKWRSENKTVKIILNRADLFEADLREANLFEANLMEADLTGANLDGVDLRKAHLHEAYLGGANLNEADLRETNLNETDLGAVNLDGADLRGADLHGAYLRQANLAGAYLSGANFTGAKIGGTIFANIALNKTIGLEEVTHASSSSIDTHTLRLSKGKIPETFLRGCGLSDADIEYSKLANPDLTNEEIVKIQYRIYDLLATQALQISPLFISYSHVDSIFVDKLEHVLNAKGVRFWRDIHDLTSGRLETQIDRAIRQNPTVLLILSRNSLSSDWVQHEVRHARKLEKELGRDALCPISLDDTWKSGPWPQRVMEQIMEYNILDFSGWESKATFDLKFSKLLSGLDLFYKKLS